MWLWLWHGLYHSTVYFALQDVNVIPVVITSVGKNSNSVSADYDYSKSLLCPIKSVKCDQFVTVWEGE